MLSVFILSLGGSKPGTAPNQVPKSHAAENDIVQTAESGHVERAAGSCLGGAEDEV